MNVPSDPNEARQPGLFEMAPAWAETWDGMPEFEQADRRPLSSVKVMFSSDEDRRTFMEMIGASAHRTAAVWYPARQRRRYEHASPAQPLHPGRYPVYVISKGRAESRLTERALERLGLPYRLVIEPQEHDEYVAHGTDPARVVQLPFSNLGQGSIPARNFVWEHALEGGHERHWILDDNIRNFARLNAGENRLILDENPFAACEQFADQHNNVALAGLQYRSMASGRDPVPPFYANTRVYSCILIDTSLPFRWRGRYNEDTDLSLRVLKAGYATVVLNAYQIDKVRTMDMQGGNTDELYAGDGRLRMAESLREQHPDVVAVTRKFKSGRWQHHVDYSPFRFNPLDREAPQECVMAS